MEYVFRCKKRADGQIELRFRYDAEFVNDLKATIPPPYRRWNPDEKAWVVMSAYLAELRELCEGYGRIVWETAPPPGGNGNGQATGAKSSDPRAEAFATLYLLPSAPIEVVKAAYRALALIHHPDKGGNPDTMKAINLAHDRLVKGAR